MWSLETERLLIIERDNADSTDNFIKEILYLKEGSTSEHITENREEISKLMPIGEVKLDFSGSYCYIGYKILEEHRKKGYASEALRALSLHCVKNGFYPRLLIEPTNEESQDVASRCGYSCDDSEVDYGFNVWTYAYRRKSS